MEIGKALLSILFVTGLLSACMKDEIPALPHVPGEITTTQLSLSVDYRYQIYFDLETNQNVGQNLKTDWDIGFECSEAGWHVKLNAAKMMKATLTNETDFDNVLDTTGDYDWKWDMESGDLDSTAIGDWQEHEKIYIIQRGYNEKGRYLGAVKIRFLPMYNDQYVIAFNEVANIGPTTYDTISKLSEINYMSYSFDGGGQAMVLEPNKNDWDLLFSQYTTYFNEENVTYLVTGVLQNPTQTIGVEDTLHDFEEINIESMIDLTLNERIDNPGYDWKTYNFDQGDYLVDVHRSYVFLTSTGYFKLRFIDYVDDNGDRGAPKFEYQRL